MEWTTARREFSHLLGRQLAAHHDGTAIASEHAGRRKRSGIGFDLARGDIELLFRWAHRPQAALTSPISPTTVSQGKCCLRRAAVQAFADGILSGPVVLGQSAVDDDDQRSAVAIGRSEVAAANDRNALRLEVIAHHLRVSTPDSNPLPWEERSLRE